MTDTRGSAGQAKIRGTRGRVLSLLREGKWTVDDLAARLGLTDNAVRFHLDALEHAGTVEKGALRRSGGVGQPAVLYSLTRVGEEQFSRAYAPVLIAFVEELREAMTPAQLIAFLKRIGKRLGSGSPATAATLWGRVTSASKLLNSLGGVTTVEKKGGAYHIVGRACPLSRAVEADHCVCTAVTSLVAEVVGADVTERCDRSGRPRCCFEISSDGPERPLTVDSRRLLDRD